MKTIEQIEGATIRGDAYSDSDLMREIHAFVTGDAPTDEKLRALAVLDRVMGAEGGRPTEADLDEYLQQSDAYFAAYEVAGLTGADVPEPAELRRLLAGRRFSVDGNPPCTAEQFVEANTEDPAQMSPEDWDAIVGLRVGETYCDGMGAPVTRLHDEGGWDDDASRDAGDWNTDPAAAAEPAPCYACGRPLDAAHAASGCEGYDKADAIDPLDDEPATDRDRY